MDTLTASFHFLRPWWLLAILPACVITFVLWKRQVATSNWRNVIDPSLLDHLLEKRQGSRQVLPLIMLLITWILACVAIAGPVWEKLPQPVRKKESALVIIQDLSLSMYATDLEPDRLTRSRRKLLDLLNKRKEGSTALIVYSGNAHIVAPLTDDSKTIASMVPALSPAIMPSYGSNCAEAVELALELFHQSAVTAGKILILTDEIVKEDGQNIIDMVANTNFPLSIIGVGTEEGSPIPTSEGFLKDTNDTIVVPRLPKSYLKKLARQCGGRYSDILLTDQDIDFVLASNQASSDSYRQVERQFDQWREQGPWLVLFILPVALLAFRRGWIFMAVFFLLLSYNDAHAFSWKDIWLNKNQQAAKAFRDGRHQQAAELFESKPWKGAAAYRAGQYDNAVEAFAELNDADSHYNRGNSLAGSGRLQEAIMAYEEALKLNPGMEDAEFNKNLVTEMLRQQQNEKKQDQQQQDQDRQEDDRASGEKGDSPDKTNDQSAQKQEKSETGQSNKFQEKSAENEQERQRREPSQADPQNEAAHAEDLKQQHTEEDINEDISEKNGDSSSAAQQENSSLSDEEQQSLQQWLRQIPDDPGGLLRRKFRYQYQTRKKKTNQGNKIW